MKRFRERDPFTVGVVGLTVLAAVAITAAVAGQRRGVPYSAAFREAAGIERDADVRVAGVRVGRVTGLDIQDGHARIDFRLDSDVELGGRSSATIGVQSVLGAKYLALAPGGPGRLAAGSQIPLTRTASPYDIAEAVNGLSRTVSQLDGPGLAAAFDALSGAFADTPEALRGSLRGLTQLSTAIAARDGQVSELLARGRAVTTVLAERDTEFRKLLADGAALLREVSARRDAIAGLLAGVSELSRQLTAMITENRAQLRPALDGLATVTSVLRRNQSHLEDSIRLLGPYVRAFGDSLGNGPWLDVYLHGLAAR